jgi:hypothetical protein
VLVCASAESVNSVSKRLEHAVSFRVSGTWTWPVHVVGALEPRSRMSGHGAACGAYKALRSQKPESRNHCNQFAFPSIHTTKAAACKPSQNRDRVRLFA